MILVLFYKDYNRALHNATSEYIIEKVDSIKVTHFDKDNYTSKIVKKNEPASYY